MPADPLEGIAQALMKAGARASVSFGRDWLVPTVTAAARTGPGNAEAGESTANLRTRTQAVGWNGTNTFLPFTANVSFVNSSGLSDDIVEGA